MGAEPPINFVSDTTYSYHAQVTDPTLRVRFTAEANRLYIISTDHKAAPYVFFFS